MVSGPFHCVFGHRSEDNSRAVPAAVRLSFTVLKQTARNRPEGARTSRTRTTRAARSAESVRTVVIGVSRSFRHTSGGHPVELLTFILSNQPGVAICRFSGILLNQSCLAAISFQTRSGKKRLKISRRSARPTKSSLSVKNAGETLC